MTAAERWARWKAERRPPLPVEPPAAQRLAQGVLDFDADAAS